MLSWIMALMFFSFAAGFALALGGLWLALQAGPMEDAPE
jgi:hypothetical protein